MLNYLQRLILILPFDAPHADSFTSCMIPVETSTTPYWFAVTCRRFFYAYMKKPTHKTPGFHVSTQYYNTRTHVCQCGPGIFNHWFKSDFSLLFPNYLILWIHPSGASMVPIWMPVKVSYSFWMVGPIFSMPLGKQISLP